MSSVFSKKAGIARKIAGRVRFKSCGIPHGKHLHRTQTVSTLHKHFESVNQNPKNTSALPETYTYIFSLVCRWHNIGFIKKNEPVGFRRVQHDDNCLA